jgi:ABC-2 type transport system permease protein
MKKILTIIAISLKMSLANRAEMFFWFVIDAVPMIAMLVLWTAVYQPGQVIGGYDLSAIITYYLVGYFVSGLVNVHIEEYWLEEIRKGSITPMLLRPFSFKVFAMLEEVGWKLLYLCLIMLPLLIIVKFSFPSLDLLKDPMTLICLGSAILLAFIIDGIFSLLAIAGGFVFEQAHSLSHLKWMLSWLLSGSMVPFELMPAWLQAVSVRLPFQYTFTVPVRLFTGRLTPAGYLPVLGTTVIWLIGLVILLQLAWRAAIKRHSSVGG